MVAFYSLEIELASSGIGVHHAGLAIDDRKLTEELFLAGLLQVIVSTSVSLLSLHAVLRPDTGVNRPWLLA